VSHHFQAAEEVIVVRVMLLEGREDVQDGPRSGQPTTRRRDAVVDIVGTLLRSDQRIVVRLIAEEGYENLFRRKDPNFGLMSGLPTMTVSCT
jgi:hypothetical protein